MRAIACVVLLAFTLQSFIAQVHIHRTFGGGASAVETPATGSPHTKIPAQNDTSDCPLCQAITHAGVFSAPSAPTLDLPVRLAETALPILLAVAIGTTLPHPWHSRAPPQSDL